MNFAVSIHYPSLCYSCWLFVIHYVLWWCCSSHRFFWGCCSFSNISRFNSSSWRLNFLFLLFFRFRWWVTIHNWWSQWNLFWCSSWLGL